MKETSLKELLKNSISRGEYLLKSGQSTTFYVDGRQATLTPTGSLQIAQAVIKIVQDKKITAVGGPALGACPIVSAVGVLAGILDYPLKLFYVRNQPKKHGKNRLIEGPTLTNEDRCLIVDDTITTGSSLLQAIDQVQLETKAQIIEVFCLVDRRQEEGVTAFSSRKISFQAMFTIAELIND